MHFTQPFHNRGISAFEITPDSYSTKREHPAGFTALWPLENEHQWGTQGRPPPQAAPNALGTHSPPCTLSTARKSRKKCTSLNAWLKLLHTNTLTTPMQALQRHSKGNQAIPKVLSAVHCQAQGGLEDKDKDSDKSSDLPKERKN